MILEKVKVAIKASETDLKETDESDIESVSMEEFNYKPASNLEHK